MHEALDCQRSLVLDQGYLAHIFQSLPRLVCYFSITCNIPFFRQDVCL